MEISINPGLGTIVSDNGVELRSNAVLSVLLAAANERPSGDGEGSWYVPGLMEYDRWLCQTRTPP